MALAAAAFAFCVHGYTASVRPPKDVTEPIKIEMARHDPRCWPVRRCELDHIVPLELGGVPLDPSNLQLQPWTDARKKDREENRLHRLVCAGRMPLPLAQALMRDWRP